MKRKNLSGIFSAVFAEQQSLHLHHAAKTTSIMKTACLQEQME